MNTLFDTLEAIIGSDSPKETLSNLTNIVDYADNPYIDLDAARKIQRAGLHWLKVMENGGVRQSFYIKKIKYDQYQSEFRKKLVAKKATLSVQLILNKKRITS